MPELDGPLTCRSAHSCADFIVLHEEIHLFKYQNSSFNNTKRTCTDVGSTTPIFFALQNPTFSIQNRTCVAIRERDLSIAGMYTRSQNSIPSYHSGGIIEDAALSGPPKGFTRLQSQAICVDNRGYHVVMWIAWWLPVARIGHRPCGALRQTELSKIGRLGWRADEEAFPALNDCLP